MVAGPTQHILLLYKASLLVPFSMFSNMFLSANVSSHTKKHYQGDNNSNRSPLDFYQVYHDIQDTEVFRRWNAHPYLLHENLNSSIVCILPRWNNLIHTVSPNLDIINSSDGLSNLVS